jgi:hypothetical protein
MVAFFLILVALLILVFAAAPFSMTEGILNIAITSVQWGINMICALVSWLANTLGLVAVGILNWASSWLVDSLAAIGLVIPGLRQRWTILHFGFQLGTVDFASMGYDTSFSPIGVALSSWVTDPFTANALGQIGLAILALIVFFVVLKTPKPRMDLSLKNRQFGKGKSKRGR